MRLLTLAVSILAVTPWMVQISNHRPQTTREVNYCELVKNPSAFSGKRIRIRGIYRYALEVQRLEAPLCCSGNSTKIWVEIDADLEGNSAKMFRKFPKDEGLVLATFTGMFETGGSYGTFADRNNLKVDQIDRVEQTKRSSRKQDDPTWVPKCAATSQP